MLAVLTVWIAGRPHRWSSEEIAFSNGSGDDVQVSAGLTELDIDEAGDDAPPGASVGWDPWPLDLAELSTQGIELCDCMAEVAEIEQGADWSDRRILVYGRIGETEYGGQGDPATAQIGSAWEDRGMLPPPDAVVADVTGADRAMPWIIGKPTSTPGIFYDATGTEKVLIAGHPVLATSVKVRNRELTAGAWSTVNTHTETVNGRRITYVHGTFTGGDPTAAQVEVDWSESEGGHPSVTGTGCPRSLRDVLAVVLSASTLPVDLASLASAGRTDGYMVDLYLDEPSPAAEIAADILGGGMPATWEAGPRGLRLKVDPILALGPDQPIDLDGPDGSPVGLISCDGEPPPDSVSVRYAAAYDGSTTLTATLRTGQGPASAVRLARPPEYVASVGIPTTDSRPRSLLRPAITRTSTSTPEPAPALEIRAPFVCDPGTANAIAAHAMRRAAARRTLSWVSPIDRAVADDGDRVRLTCSRWHLTDALAVVERVERDLLGGTATYHARLLPS